MGRPGSGAAQALPGLKLSPKMGVVTGAAFDSDGPAPPLTTGQPSARPVDPVEQGLAEGDAGNWGQPVNPAILLVDAVIDDPVLAREIGDQGVVSHAVPSVAVLLERGIAAALGAHGCRRRDRSPSAVSAGAEPGCSIG